MTVSRKSCYFRPVIQMIAGISRFVRGVTQIHSCAVSILRVLTLNVGNIGANGWRQPIARSIAVYWRQLAIAQIHSPIGVSIALKKISGGHGFYQLWGAKWGALGKKIKKY